MWSLSGFNLYIVEEFGNDGEGERESVIKIEKMLERVWHCEEQENVWLKKSNLKWQPQEVYEAPFKIANRIYEVEIDNYENSGLDTVRIIFWIELDSWEDCVNWPALCKQRGAVSVESCRQLEVLTLPRS